MSGARNIVDRLLAAALVLIMAVLTLDVLWQVLSRYVLASPSSWTEELARFLLIWVSLLGAAYLSGQNAHLAIDVLPKRLRDESRRRLEIGIHVVIIVFALTVLVGGGSNLIYVTLRLGQLSPALNVPLGYVYLVLPVSGILMMFYSVAEIIAPIRQDQTGR
ncbi:MAG: TRAP transporter small permease [Rhodothermales bacterium]|nr:TRAP transporter small permease [Rhodothermales bacterium]